MKCQREAQTRQRRYDALAPEAGDAALNVELRAVNGESPVRLSDFWDREPVALIFGGFI